MKRRLQSPIYVLGINDSHCATAALLKDGEIIACVSEERFTQIKNHPGIPAKSIKYCLAYAKIKPSQLGRVIVSSTTFPPIIFPLERSTKKIKPQAESLITKLYQKARYLHYLLRQTLEYRWPFFRKFNLFLYNLGVSLLALKFTQERGQRISQFLNISPVKVTFIDHHLAHAFAAYYSSPFAGQNQPALVFTGDCQGDKLSATVNIFKGKKCRRVAATTMADSLGALYTEVTMFLGMTPAEHEYKVMGLAPFAPESGVAKAYQIMKDLIKLDKKTLSFKAAINSELFGRFLKDHLAGIRFDYIAGAIQKITEELLVDWVKAAIKKYHLGRIACGGGVFMNVKANQKIAALSEVKEVFFMPSCGDESNAIGAAYWGYLQQKNQVPSFLKDLYLGPEYSNKEIGKILKKPSCKNKYLISYHQDIEEILANLLAKGEIVATFSGRMEWGARALGNRSILADAAKDGVVEEINRLIKSRDFWMPFAPVILEEHTHKYLINPKDLSAPFMNLGFDTTAEGQKSLKAAIHPYDKTARPQIIRKDDNPRYYQIIDKFFKKTGRAGLLNTSFNLHGFPIVSSPEDALRVLANSGLKYLALENYLLYYP